MSVESDLLEEGLMVREDSDFGGILEYGKLRIPCSLGSIGHGARLVAGGFSKHAEMTVVVRKSALKGEINFKTGQKVAVVDSTGKRRSLKIAGEGIRDIICAVELTLNDENEQA